MNFAVRIRRIVEHRRVLWTLVKRDLRVRYARSFLGYVWTLIDPLAMTLIYTFVFGVVYNIGGGPNGKIRSDGVPLPLFLVGGILAWNWFNASTTETARALYAERRLVRSTNLPRELWVIRVVLSKGVEFLMSLPVLAGFIIFFTIRGEADLNWKIVFWIPAVLIEIIMCIGVGLVMAPVTAMVEDFVRLVRIALRMGFYVTPIVYSVRYLADVRDKPTIARLLEVNPMTGIIDLFREGFVKNVSPEWHMWAWSFVASVLVFIFGMWVFAKMEKAILKEI